MDIWLAGAKEVLLIDDVNQLLFIDRLYLFEMDGIYSTEPRGNGNEGTALHLQESYTIHILIENSDDIKVLVDASAKSGIRTATTMEASRSQYHFQEMVILGDLSCPDIAVHLQYANLQGYFKAPYRWMILQDFSNDSLDIFEELDIFPDSDLVIAKKIGSAYEITEAYKISSNSRLIQMTRQFWYGTPVSLTENCVSETDVDVNSLSQIEPDLSYETNNAEMSNCTENYETNVMKNGRSLKYCNCIKNTDKRSLSVKRRDMKQHALTMALVITDSNDTKNHLSDRLQLHQDSITKMSYNVMKLCFEMLNATEKVIFTHTWGYPDKNGRWQGLIDHLLRNEADLGTITIFTKERMAYIDYIAMVGTTAVRFVFREPPLSNVSNVFTLPFARGVWLAILVCLLASALFLYITSKWEATVGMHPLQLDGSWADVLILITGAVLQQGCTLEPRYAAGRCVMLLLFLSLTILYAAYSANIVVLLRAPSSSIRTVQDLLNSPMALGASDFDYNKYFLRQLKDPLRKTIYEKKIAPKGKKPHFYNMSEGVEKIRKGLFAFHMELNPGYRLIQETYREDEKCDLVEINYINEFDPWLPGQKRGPYKEIFKTSFMKIRESGIQKAIHQRLNVPKPRCSGSVVAFSSVGVVDMYPALILTLYGFLAAVIVLMIEKCHYKLRTVRKKMKIKFDSHLDVRFKD
ncbi:Glutamate receptor 4 [Eumeta japonica]|uniref:Glutamate receptor 4 n=1 Tax=Eumeta variegata TaxID=151549 RepID=A0A4C1VAY7_EUMVA|nr:Glutamate receptor 4 [Eumeta japonica]